jgi:hypothetical protein
MQKSVWALLAVSNGPPGRVNGLVLDEALLPVLLRLLPEIVIAR